ncbi:MAG: hypothetical protein IPK80_01325 [Nannocystis sp.]|nr:hypothetical protein [Nannocystis sp.]
MAARLPRRHGPSSNRRCWGRPAHRHPRQESPLELYNLIQFIDPTAFYSAGIYDPEQFIDRFIKIELRDVLTSDFKIESASAVTGFRNLDDLRTIIFSKSEFRSAAEVGLQLPRPIVETVTVAMDELQEAKYDKYVREIERILAEPAKPDSGGPSNVIVGLLARLSLVALHSGLDEGYNLKNALDGGVATRNVYDPRTGEVEEITVTLPRPIYESPKLTACAERIVASPHCGHIIFVEPTAVHMWMREVLVANGIPRERIAILNSEVSTSERATIAREFNGLSSAPAKPGACARPSDFATAPKYDIVIANSVAYEGSISKYAPAPSTTSTSPGRPPTSSNATAAAYARATPSASSTSTTTSPTAPPTATASASSTAKPGGSASSSPAPCATPTTPARSSSSAPRTCSS